MPAPVELRATPFSPMYPAELETDWIDVFGCAVPIHCGDIEGEYTALRTAAAAMEFSMLFRWDVTGDGALATVNSLFSRDLTALAADEISYGCFVDDDGHMIDDVTIIVPSPEHVRVIGGNFDVNDAMLRSTAPEGVDVVERRDEMAHLSVQGPKSREILQSMTDADLSNEAFPYYRYRQDVPIAGIVCQINRMGFTAELGFECIMAVDKAVAFGEALMAAGSDHGLVLAGSGVVMMARLEAGMVMAGLEYDDTSTPFETRLGWAVDFDKGDFRGRDALVTAKDNIRERVVSVVIDGIEEAEFAPISVGGEQVGVVTMALPSPVLQGKTLGLARLARSAAKVGTLLTGDADGTAFTAEVVATPVYEAERTRVNS